MRLFVALEVPPTWRAAATRVRRDLERALGEDVRVLRWVDPQLLHLTLRFLGEYPDGEVARLQVALGAHIRDVDVELATSRLGTFGTPRRLRTVWIGVGGDLEGLRALARAVDAAADEASATAPGPEVAPFTPHLTVARVRERATAQQREAVAAAVQAIELAPLTMHARGVALVRSQLGGGPPRHEVLSRYPAGAAPAPEAKAPR